MTVLRTPSDLNLCVTKGNFHSMELFEWVENLQNFQCEIKFKCKKFLQTLPVSKNFPCQIFSVQMLAVSENFPIYCSLSHSCSVQCTVYVHRIYAHKLLIAHNTTTSNYCCQGPCCSTVYCNKNFLSWISKRSGLLSVMFLFLLPLLNCISCSNFTFSLVSALIGFQMQLSRHF